MLPKELKLIYKDQDLLVVNKPSGIVVYSSKLSPARTLINLVLKQYPQLKKVGKPPRYGLVHRLDKETSGILMIAKTNEALRFLQEQFSQRKVLKKYIALVVGNLQQTQGKIETLLGRSPGFRKKQRVYLPYEPAAKGKNLKKGISRYRLLERFKDYTLVEITLKTGRKHQIRVQFAYLGHPVAGDKKYGFKNQSCPKGLDRQFIHAKYLKCRIPSGEMKEFTSDLPEDLRKVLQNLNKDR